MRFAASVEKSISLPIVLRVSKVSGIVTSLSGGEVEKRSGESPTFFMLDFGESFEAMSLTSFSWNSEMLLEKEICTLRLVSRGLAVFPFSNLISFVLVSNVF